MASQLFAAAADKARARELGVVDLIGAIETLKAAGEAPLTLELYKIWLQHNGDDPLRYAVYFNFGVALTDSSNSEAKAAFEQSIAHNKDFLPPYINLGSALERAGSLDKAIEQWYHVVNSLGTVDGTNITYKTTALKQIGRVLENANIDEQAEQALRLGLDINPHQRDAIQHFIALRQRQCKWPVIAPWNSVSQSELMQNISPLSIAVYADDPIFQLANAYNYNTKEVGQPAPHFTAGRWTPPEQPRSGRLKIGYVSSDLREHAVGFLTTEIFGLHDRTKVEVFAYYCGIKPEDKTKERIRADVDHWIDISDMNDRDAAKRIVSDGIDILVDLNGYTKDARTKLFALRPAPIIVNWLGFPGSMGSPYHNYIIADEFIIPREHEVYYSEKVMRLPCYQPTDRGRTVAEMPTRTEAGLPEDAVVFCGFNGTQKITPGVFARWMKILSGVPNSALWMLSGSEETHDRLRETAEQHGISRERLYFAPKKRNPEHMARYPLADLFLDTFPYGAHTTASDAMWMGVPVLTVPGRGFASRVCASLVRAAGIGDLICSDGEEYVARGIELGNDRAKLARFKSRLQSNRDRSTLFDIPGLVRNLEDLFRQMWSDFEHGKLHEPDLSNLDIYHEIGCELDVEKAAELSLSDYQARYRTRLTYRDSVLPVRADTRLWRAENRPVRIVKAA